jgi:hypothetical protein
MICPFCTHNKDIRVTDTDVLPKGARRCGRINTRYSCNTCGSSWTQSQEFRKGVTGPNLANVVPVPGIDTGEREKDEKVKS